MYFNQFEFEPNSLLLCQLEAKDNKVQRSLLHTRYLHSSSLLLYTHIITFVHVCEVVTEMGRVREEGKREGERERERRQYKFLEI